MTDSSIESVCRDCGRPLSFHAESTAPARCAECFDGFLRVRDVDFLNSYSELGVTSRRIVAEASLRALVLESPPVRKVLAMHIMEQYIHATSDLIGLYHALKQRGQKPIMQAALEFKLDRTTAVAFFSEMATTPGPELLAALGLPDIDTIAGRCPSLSKSDVRDLKRALVQLLGDLKRTGDMGESAALALVRAAGENRAGAAMVKQSSWLDGVGLRANQVASIAIDQQRRTISVSTITVDEKRLTTIVSAIDAMTNASRNLIYGVLTMYQEEDRAKKLGESKRKRSGSNI